MTRRAIVVASVAVLALGCGGIAVVSPSDDASTDAADATADGTADALPSLPPCKTTADCFGSETCQSGWCCSGTLVGADCRCGVGPGCDLTSTCCADTWPPDAAITCHVGGCPVHH